MTKRDLPNGNAEILLQYFESGEQIGRYDEGNPLLILWRPKSKMMSFVNDNKGDHKFQLTFWTPRDSKIAVPNVPIMSQGYKTMRWSPDGRYLGFRIPTTDLTKEQLCLFDMEKPSEAPKTIFEAESILDFAWSPDAKTICLSLEGTDGALILLDPQGKNLKTLRVSRGQRINHVTWSLDGKNVITACRTAGRGDFTVRSVDLDGRSSIVASPPSGRVIGTENPLPDGRFLFDLFGEGMAIQMIAGLDTEPHPFVFPNGTNWYGCLEKTRNSLIISHTSSTEPRQLYRVNLTDETDYKVVYKTPGTENIKGVEPQRLSIPLREGNLLNALIWRADRGKNRGLIIRFPTNRTDNPSSEFNGAVQYLVSKGFDYISFGFRPQKLEDPTIFNTALNDDIKDAMELIEYAKSVIGVRADKILLFGESVGTSFVIRTAGNLSDKQGILVLRGLVDIVKDFRPIPDNQYKVTLLQGENDPLKPIEAVNYIKTIFGPESLEGKRGFWMTLYGEGHSPRLLRSHASVAASIYTMLISQD